jgi:hypothetical protein
MRNLQHATRNAQPAPITRSINLYLLRRIYTIAEIDIKF